jgi:catechol 2,3-dioxygenase-like lactoylglutathione lyase family enzyme
MPVPNSLQPFAFVLAVQDLDRSTAYFRDVLGFHAEWADASDWRLLSRGHVRIMLGSSWWANPSRGNRHRHASVYRDAAGPHRLRVLPGLAHVDSRNGGPS